MTLEEFVNKVAQTVIIKGSDFCDISINIKQKRCDSAESKSRLLIYRFMEHEKIFGATYAENITVDHGEDIEQPVNDRIQELSALLHSYKIGHSLRDGKAELHPWSYLFPKKKVEEMLGSADSCSYNNSGKDIILQGLIIGLPASKVVEKIRDYFRTHDI